MARIDQRDERNADGAWFVDTRCIDCGTCHQLVPELFAPVGDQSVVAVQPHGAGGEHRAWLAAEACPTQSIGRLPRATRPAGLYPLLVDGPVYDLGHTSEASFGATSYFVLRPEGNLMIDAPRYTRALTAPLDDLGGVAHILLTHRDDVADAPRWADRYRARVWIHEADRSAAPVATDLFRGEDPVVVAPGVVAVPVPGHTRGSVAFLVDATWLFTGDSLAWSHRGQDLVAFRDACWYSWPEQTRSLRRLAGTSFSWVLPGHGARVRLEPDDAHHRLVRLVERMGRVNGR
jgi:glyoxylase-like metal-dependent hydrolase (beta-lactamase superfamily II)/ferredoxin